MSKRLEGGYLGGRPSWSLTASPGIWAIEQVLARRVAGTWPGGQGSFDEFYEYVALLLHGNGANASTTFQDSSLYGRALTVGGSVKISTAQSKFGGASILFGGADWLNVTVSQAGAIAFGDYTFECWVYPTSYASSTDNHIAHFKNDSSTATTVLAWACDNQGIVKVSTGAVGLLQGGGTYKLTLNAWNHVAVTRSSGTMRLFVNGNIDATVTDNTSRSFTDVFIGKYLYSSTNGLYWNGYIDEFRISNGYARYTSNFTIPTSPGEDEGAILADPFYNYVSLLLPMNGSNNSTTFADKSQNAKTITPSGDAKLLTAVKRYGTASAYFDGTGDGISTADVAIGTGDFTIEMWINTTSATRYAQLIGNEGVAGFTLLINNDSASDGKIAIYIGGGLRASTTTTGYNDGKWHHVAVTRAGTAITIWIDGASAGTGTASTTMTGASDIWIGRNNYYTGRDFAGYIDDLRITKGVARYIANFIPPLPHADYGTLVDPYLSSTSLLMPMEGPNNSTGFFDRADRLPVTTYGNAKISNAQYKWGLTSAFFDGSGDYLTIPAGTQFAYGSSDFTIELWLYKAASGSMAILDSTGAGGFGFLVNDTQVQSYVTNGATFTVTYSIPLNTWTHIAYSRSGTTLRLFVNGSQIGSNTDSNSYTSPADLNIGRNPNSNTAFLNGYIDDLRIVKGFARYTTNFTPPTAAFNSDSTSDPYLSNVSLLLKMDGANTSTTFTDSSLTPKAVFANGDAKISTTQSKFGGASAYFDGNGDYLVVNDSSAFDLSNGSFTVEFWVNFNSLSGYQQLFDLRTTSSSTTSPTLYASSSNIQFDVGTTNAITITSAFSTGVWYHVALCKSGASTRLFINGVQGGSTYTDNNTYVNNSTINIGRYPVTNSSFLNGYIDDFRFTKGVARYTGNFLPPTVSHPVWSQTDASFNSVSLLLSGDGANASTVIADRSTNGLTAVPSGNAQISTAQSRFGGSSLYFDGTGDFLTVSSSVFNISASEDFTWEAWIYPTTTGGYKCIFNNDTGFSSAPRLYLNGTGLLAYVDAADRVTHQTAVQTNTWQHVAMVRASNVIRVYLNGVQSSSSYSHSSATTTNALRIGSDTGANAQDFAGYIDDLRVTKGVARYTATFAPPVAPHPIPVVDAKFGAVSLLLHMNGANASTYFPDYSYNASTVTVGGNAQISTAQSMFGGSSALFDGSGDSLTIAATDATNLPGDFTIELWVRPVSFASTMTVLGKWGASNRAWLFSIDSATQITFVTGNGAIGGIYSRTPSSTLTVNTWHHLAVSRSGSTIKIFVNGVQAGADITDSNNNTASQVTAVGINTDGNVNSFNGHIDEVRITKGIARYTAAFTPPTAPFPHS